jgi:membrane protein DedA with SNARE-associated domain
MFGRMLPGIRAFISMPAGVERMPLPKFVLLTTLGSLMWNATLLITGYLLGENWQRVADIAGIFQYVAIGLICLIAVRFVLKRRARRRAAATSGGRCGDEP